MLKGVILCCCLLSSVSIFAESTKPLVIGSQNIDYFPHYHFGAKQDKGFAWALLETFAQSQNLQFEYQSFPIKRLQLELSKGNIDFVYPDNPRWYPNQASTNGKTYSVGLVTSTNGTIVRKGNKDLGLSQFKSLALPFGFTPVKWQQLDIFDRIRKVTTPDAHSALKMVQLGRVDGADVEYNVMRHTQSYLKGEKRLVMDRSLPYSEVDFMLSSVKHPQIIRKLTQYIVNNPEQVKRLRERYGIMLPQE